MASGERASDSREALAFGAPDDELPARQQQQQCQLAFPRRFPHDCWLSPASSTITIVSPMKRPNKYQYASSSLAGAGHLQQQQQRQRRSLSSTKLHRNEEEEDNDDNRSECCPQEYAAEHRSPLTSSKLVGKPNQSILQAIAAQQQPIPRTFSASALGQRQPLSARTAGQPTDRASRVSCSLKTTANNSRRPSGNQHQRFSFWESLISSNSYSTSGSVAALNCAGQQVAGSPHPLGSRSNLQYTSGLLNCASASGLSGGSCVRLHQNGQLLQQQHQAVEQQQDRLLVGNNSAAASLRPSSIHHHNLLCAANCVAARKR